MQYSQLVAPRRSIIVNEATPEPGRGEVLVEVKACGVCASELHPWMDPRGSYPYRIGHEPAGIVNAVGPDVSRFKPGDRVTGLFQPAYSDYAVAREDDILLVPEGITLCERPPSDLDRRANECPFGIAPMHQPGMMRWLVHPMS
jgi:NADPH:quinone reductase-like Zn-dependent oxidoreductase